MSFSRPRGLASALLVALGLVALPLSAQQETPPDSTDFIRTILLPRAAEILREQGVPEEEVREVVTGAREQGVPPAEATDVLEETAQAVEENGPVENFGAFVQARLQDGLRGRELAQAIRAEHAARGIGRGARLDGRRGPPEGRGPNAARNRGARPESAGSPAERGGPPADRARGGRPDTIRPDTAGGIPATRRPRGNGGGA